MAFLPATLEEMTALGWEAPDFVLVTGDAYVDHPSFGAALIGRLLSRYGYKVAVLDAPFSFMDRESLTIKVGLKLKQAGYALADRFPCLAREKTGWKVLIYFSGQGKPLPELAVRELPSSLAAPMYVEGPWDERVLMAVHHFEQQLWLRNLEPSGPIQISPLRQPGQMLLPHERDEQRSELRVLVSRRG